MVLPYFTIWRSIIMKMDFVKVHRVEHDDYMVIPKMVQEQYPKKYVLVEVETEVEETVVPKRRGRKVNA